MYRWLYDIETKYIEIIQKYINIYESKYNKYNFFIRHFQT